MKKDAAPLHLEPASNKYAFSSELGIANSSSLQGLDCFVAALPGEKAAAGQEKIGERLCLREELQPQDRGALASLPIHNVVIKSTRLG